MLHVLQKHLSVTLMRELTLPVSFSAHSAFLAASSKYIFRPSILAYEGSRPQPQ